MIWIDADGAPRAVKEIVYRAAERLGIEVVLVANQHLRLPRSPWISQVKVGAGFDVADDYIAAHVEEEDIVITSDIPLASAVSDKGAVVIDPRHGLLSPDDIRRRMSVRELLEDLRTAGEIGGGPPPFGERDKRNFANALDRLLTSRMVVLE